MPREEGVAVGVQPRARRFVVPLDAIAPRGVGIVIGFNLIARAAAGGGVIRLRAGHRRVDAGDGRAVHHARQRREGVGEAHGAAIIAAGSGGVPVDRALGDDLIRLVVHGVAGVAVQRHAHGVLMAGLEGVGDLDHVVLCEVIPGHAVLPVHVVVHVVALDARAVHGHGVVRRLADLRRVHAGDGHAAHGLLELAKLVADEQVFPVAL